MLTDRLGRTEDAAQQKELPSGLSKSSTKGEPMKTSITAAVLALTFVGWNDILIVGFPGCRRGNGI